MRNIILGVGTQGSFPGHDPDPHSKIRGDTTANEHLGKIFVKSQTLNQNQMYTLLDYIGYRNQVIGCNE